MFPEKDTATSDEGVPNINTYHGTVVDFDGEVMRFWAWGCNQHYKRGPRGWKWLHVFQKETTHRRAEICFEREFGPKKGGWKGGTRGMSWYIADEDLKSSIEKQLSKEGALRAHFDI